MLQDGHLLMVTTMINRNGGAEDFIFCCSPHQARPSRWAHDYISWYLSQKQIDLWTLKRHHRSSVPSLSPSTQTRPSATDNSFRRYPEFHMDRYVRSCHSPFINRLNCLGLDTQRLRKSVSVQSNSSTPSFTHIPPDRRRYPQSAILSA